MTEWITDNLAYTALIGCVLLVIIVCIVLTIVRRMAARGRQDYLGLDELDGQSFEIWCAELLADNGFENVRVTKGSGDQGVDILAEKDDVRFAIQCKLYSSPLGNRPVQEVFAGKTIYNCHVGVVMTNSTFTSGAKEAAEKTGVILWGADRLEAFLQTARD